MENAAQDAGQSVGAGLDAKETQDAGKDAGAVISNRDRSEPAAIQEMKACCGRSFWVS